MKQNPHSPGLTEDECDDFSERSALAVLRQVKGVIAGAGQRELRARMEAGQLYLDPFYAYAGASAGCVTAIISTLWSLMDPGDDPAEAAESLGKLMHSIVDAQMADIVKTPPGELTGAFAKAEAQRKRGMT